MAVESSSVESTYPLLPVADALALVLQQTQPLPAKATPLTEAVGQVLAVAVTAPEPLPPFPASPPNISPVSSTWTLANRSSLSKGYNS